MQSILSVPDPTLRNVSTPIATITPELQDYIQDLVDTLRAARDPEGVGLSFPQIGHNIRGFVTYLEKKVRVYLNPIIIDASEETTLGGTPERPTLEGCLSIPHFYGPVPRAKKIKIQAINEKGETINKTLTSFAARVFLHEQDHLDGVLFTDYTIRHNLPLYMLDNIKNEFVQIEDPSIVVKW